MSVEKRAALRGGGYSSEQIHLAELFSKHQSGTEIPKASIGMSDVFEPDEYHLIAYFLRFVFDNPKYKQNSKHKNHRDYSAVKGLAGMSCWLQGSYPFNEEGEHGSQESRMEQVLTEKIESLKASLNLNMRLGKLSWFKEVSILIEKLDSDLDRPMTEGTRLHEVVYEVFIRYIQQHRSLPTVSQLRKLVDHVMLKEGEYIDTKQWRRVAEIYMLDFLNKGQENRGRKPDALGDSGSYY